MHDGPMSATSSPIGATPAATVRRLTVADIARFKAGRFGSVMLFVALISLFGGYLMKVYAWRTILGTEGIINNALMALGIVSEPVTWLLYNPPSVVLTLTNFLFPFAMLPIAAAMRVMIPLLRFEQKRSEAA